MLTKVFSVYDSKACFFGVPFFMPSIGGAVRAFADISNDQQTVVGRHPEDFVLYEIGSFDDKDAKLLYLDPKKVLGIASDFKQVPVGPPVVVPISAPVAEVASDGS